MLNSLTRRSEEVLKLDNTCGPMLEIRIFFHLQIIEIDCGFLHQAAFLMVTSSSNPVQSQFCIGHQSVSLRACLFGMPLRTYTAYVVARQKSVLEMPEAGPFFCPCDPKMRYAVVNQLSKEPN